MKLIDTQIFSYQDTDGVIWNLSKFLLEDKQSIKWEIESEIYREYQHCLMETARAASLMKQGIHPEEAVSSMRHPW